MREYLLKDLEPVTLQQLYKIGKSLGLHIHIQNNIVYVRG